MCARHLYTQSEKVDLREYHYDLIKFRGLSEHHHELMCKHFQEVMDELGSVLPAGENFYMSYSWDCLFIIARALDAGTLA